MYGFYTILYNGDCMCIVELDCVSSKFQCENRLYCIEVCCSIVV